MSLTAVSAGRPTRTPLAASGSAAPCLLATLAFLCLHAANGFPTLANPAGDNDSLLRLVEVRDLLAGQGWFDLRQLRLGMDGGVVMHWSRLVDLPIAILIRLGTLVSGGREGGEAAALVIWPALLFFASLLALTKAAVRLAGEAARLPALVIGATTLHYLGLFAPGAIDHHNVQIALTLGTLACLLAAFDLRASGLGALAGGLSAVSLAVAMEAVPVLAAFGLVAALWLVVSPAAWRASCGFGMGLAGVALALFVATVPPTAWTVSACDAFSLPQFAGAGLAGAGLAALAATVGRLRSAGARLGATLVLGLLLVLVLAWAFPQCLADPYAGLDGRLKGWWLNQVLEAQPLWRILPVDPGMAAGRVMPALLALGWLAWQGLRRGMGGRLPLLALPLGAAVLVSAWQVRGSVFSLPLAVLPLAAMVAAARARLAAGPGAIAALALAAAWLLSLNGMWQEGVGRAAAAFGKADAGAPAAGGAATWERAGDFASLAALPATGVLAVSNLGSPVLAFTPHRVLAGPYHRNVAGNLAVLDAFTGSPDRARAIAAGNGLTVLALCPGNDETAFLAKNAPGGFLAELLAGRLPPWLEPVPGTQGASLRLYRIVAAR